MALPKDVRKRFIFAGSKQGKMTFRQLLQVGPEVPQKQLVVLGGQKGENMVVVLLQMLKKVQKNRIRSFAVKNVPMAVFLALCVKYMAKQFFTIFLQQKILGFKMGIEGGSAHIRPVDNFTDSDVTKIFFGKQLRKGAENGLPCLSLTSVHRVLRTISEKCSVTNEGKDSYIE